MSIAEKGKYERLLYRLYFSLSWSLINQAVRLCQKWSPVNEERRGELPGKDWIFSKGGGSERRRLSPEGAVRPCKEHVMQGALVCISFMTLKFLVVSGQPDMIF